MRFLVLALLALPPVAAQKLTPEQRVEIIRGMTAEDATAKNPLPRSRKPLLFSIDGQFDKKEWAALGREYGPAARAGDMVRITKVSIEQDRLILEINGGFKGGRRWYEGVEVGMGTSTRRVAGGSNAPGGTVIALLFHKPLPPLKAAEIKKLLAPLLDFEKRTATESVLESLPPEIKQAVIEKRAVEGMDRDQVLMALGKPVRKVREVKDGVEMEDWVYGRPPGKIVFVTFDGNKAVRVKETYAGLGTEAAPLSPPR